MLAIHAVWDWKRLHIWAESSVLPLTVSPPRGRPAKNPKPRPHPFSVPGEMLNDEIETAFESAPSSIETITCLLPSTKRGPLPSPWLIREDCPIEKPSRLSPWSINSATFDPYSALDLLIDLPAHPPHGIAFAASLRFWIEAARLALEIIAKEQFAPTIRDGKAVWVPVIDGGDRARIEMLEEALPPSARSIFEASEPGEDATPERLVESFIDRTVAAFVFESLKASQTRLEPPRRGRPPRRAPLPRQFLRAIADDCLSLEASSREMTDFSTKMRAWHSMLEPAPSDALLRTSFRLEAPTNADDELWQLRIFLQAKDDRSLLVPAEEVWRARSSTITLLQRSMANPQEQLLADLGRASRIYPWIDRCLQSACPDALDLSTEEAYAFLREAAPLLEQNGFGVLLPAWWEKPSVGIGMKLKLKTPSSNSGGSLSQGLFGTSSIVNYDWEMALGDMTLSEEEFRELIDLKVPLVQVRGEWVELRSEDVESAIKSFEERRMGGTITMGEALRLALGAGDMLSSPLHVAKVEAEGKIKEMLAVLSEGGEMATVEAPPSFKGQLRPYQEKGLSWLAYLQGFGLGACLADDMGLGKTIELLAFLLHEKEGSPSTGPTLLICPMSVVGNWEREIERFSPSIEVLVHHGSQRLSEEEFADAAKGRDLVITTYATAQRDEATLATVDWEHVVLDEAQNIKNPSAKQTQAIKKLKAGKRIALTGTPVENRLSELWSIMDFLNPGFLGSAKGFREKFALPIEKYRNTEQAAALRRMTQPFILRRLKTDPDIISDLPEKVEAKVYCNLTPEQASLYGAVVEEMLREIESSAGIERKGKVLATLTRLKQICNHPALFIQDGSVLGNRSGKLARLEEMLEEVLAAGEKALIFTQYAGMGTMLRHHLQEKLGCEALFLHGGTPKKERDRMIERFQSDGPPLFILSLKAGGLGLNLTAASYVFHFDRWWNPAVENQATDRAFRIGQKKNVFVNKFVCMGTLEERIDKMIEEKKVLAESIVGTGEGWLTELSTDELREVIALSRDALMR